MCFVDTFPLVVFMASRKLRRHGYLCAICVLCCSVTLCNGTVRKIHEDPDSGRLSTVEYVPKAQPQNIPSFEVAGEIHSQSPVSNERSSPSDVNCKTNGESQKAACNGHARASGSPASPPRAENASSSKQSSERSTSDCTPASKSSKTVRVTGDMVVVAEGCFSTHRKLLVDDTKKDVYVRFESSFAVHEVLRKFCEQTDKKQSFMSPPPI